MNSTVAREWNHNIHYYEFVLCAVPPNCGLALDVGCGRGLLTRQLASACGLVVGMDNDYASLSSAKKADGSATYIHGDTVRPPFSDGTFDFIAVVAALHHLPLESALERFRDLLRPGGVLAIVGLYRASSFADYLVAAAALPLSRVLRLRRGYSDVGAPLHEPLETLRQIRSGCARLLPGIVIRRRLLFRYTAIWRKP